MQVARLKLRHRRGKNKEEEDNKRGDKYEDPKQKIICFLAKKSM